MLCSSYSHFFNNYGSFNADANEVDGNSCHILSPYYVPGILLVFRELLCALVFSFV